MRKTIRIALREYLEAVKTKAFIIGIVVQDRKRIVLVVVGTLHRHFKHPRQRSRAPIPLSRTDP